MKKWCLLFMISCCTFIHGTEGLHKQVMEDCVRGIRETNPDQLWMFNGQMYLLNESGQLEPASYHVPENFGKWLDDLARRGVCPKEHQGVYLDQTFYECGIWCCRGVMRDGLRCPYHIDVQYPNGIPKTQ